MSDDGFDAVVDDWIAAERARKRLAATPEALEAQTLFKVLMLAPRVEVAEALLRGEKVPRSKLDPIALRAYGRS